MINNKKQYAITKNKLLNNIFLEKIKLEEIKESDTVHMLTDGKIKLIDIIEFLIKDKQECELYIATLSFNLKEFDVIIQLFDTGNINKIRFIKCNLYNKKREKIYNHAKECLEKRGQKMISINSHCKVFLIKTKEKYYTLSGSMNLTANSLLENLLITTTPETYQFYKNWFDVSFRENGHESKFKTAKEYRSLING